MGTRADFYLGTGAEAIWLGSIGMDGDPASVLTDDAQLSPPYELDSGEDWVQAVREVFEAHREHTLPEQGWPWPWDDSRVTDYAYAYENGRVHVSCFGSYWMPADIYQKLTAEQEGALEHGVEVFPNMSEVKNIRWDAGNAPMMLSGDGRLLNPPITKEN